MSGTERQEKKERPGVGGRMSGNVRFCPAKKNSPPPPGAAPAPQEPWVQAKEVEADAPLTSLLAGNTPRLITVRDGAVTLRFDRAGKLLTQLPKGQEGGEG